MDRGPTDHINISPKDQINMRLLQIILSATPSPLGLGLRTRMLVPHVSVFFGPVLGCCGSLNAVRHPAKPQSPMDALGLGGPFIHRSLANPKLEAMVAPAAGISTEDSK